VGQVALMRLPSLFYLFGQLSLDRLWQHDHTILVPLAAAEDGGLDAGVDMSLLRDVDECLPTISTEDQAAVQEKLPTIDKED
jgi:hypothetical protein